MLQKLFNRCIAGHKQPSTLHSLQFCFWQQHANLFYNSEVMHWNLSMRECTIFLCCHHNLADNDVTFTNKLCVETVHVIQKQLCDACMLIQTELSQKEHTQNLHAHVADLTNSKILSFSSWRADSYSCQNKVFKNGFPRLVVDHLYSLFNMISWQCTYCTYYHTK